MDWTYGELDHAVAEGYGKVHARVWAGIGSCGTWWTGPQRVAIVAHVRGARNCELCQRRRSEVSPEALPGDHDGGNTQAELISAGAIEAVHRITTDPGRLTRAFVQATCADIGEEAYVELAALVATAVAIDGFAEALGADLRALPQPGGGEPSCRRPDGMGDVGAFVSQALDKRLANVSRAASLVPDTAALWQEVVSQHYSRGAEFAEAVWQRPLSRPQVEVVAATVSQLNQCFY
jgi:hypothetical protein